MVIRELLSNGEIDIYFSALFQIIFLRGSIESKANKEFFNSKVGGLGTRKSDKYIVN